MFLRCYSFILVASLIAVTLQSNEELKQDEVKGDNKPHGNEGPAEKSNSDDDQDPNQKPKQDEVKGDNKPHGNEGPAEKSNSDDDQDPNQKQDPNRKKANDKKLLSGEGDGDHMPGSSMFYVAVMFCSLVFLCLLVRNRRKFNLQMSRIHQCFGNQRQNGQTYQKLSTTVKENEICEQSRLYKNYIY